MGDVVGAAGASLEAAAELGVALVGGALLQPTAPRSVVDAMSTIAVLVIVMSLSLVVLDGPMPSGGPVFWHLFDTEPVSARPCQAPGC